MRQLVRPRLLIVAGVTAGVGLIAQALTGNQIGLAIIPITVLSFTAGRDPSRPAGRAAFAGLIAGVAGALIIRRNGGSLVPDLMLPITLFIAGYALRARETVAAGLVAQGEQLEAERDAYARLSVRYERARIAAELHDVVAHAISVMVVQAGAGQRLAIAEPARTHETFAVIATSARQAEADLDRLAGLLAQDGGGDDERLEGVPEIVNQATAAGLPVTLRFEGDTSGIRGAVAHAGFRVVQEGLTNALRYAPGAPVTVQIRARPASLEVSVANVASAAPPESGLGTGRGLTGLRERVGACGGTLRAGPDDARGWILRAHIPC